MFSVEEILPRVIPTPASRGIIQADKTKTAGRETIQFLSRIIRSSNALLRILTRISRTAARKIRAMHRTGIIHIPSRKASSQEERKQNASNNSKETTSMIRGSSNNLHLKITRENSHDNKNTVLLLPRNPDMNKEKRPGSKADQEMRIAAIRAEGENKFNIISYTLYDSLPDK